jgi:hypothetical protein
MFQQMQVGVAARRKLLIYVSLPLAYVVCGRLGLFLAVSPGYATAVFLPAGIAVGGMFIAGAGTLPGTFAGSFLLNLWIGYSIAHRLDAIGIAAALIIALWHSFADNLFRTATNHLRVGFAHELIAQIRTAPNKDEGRLLNNGLQLGLSLSTGLLGALLMLATGHTYRVQILADFSLVPSSTLAATLVFPVASTACNTTRPPE